MEDLLRIKKDTNTVQAPSVNILNPASIPSMGSPNIQTPKHLIGGSAQTAVQQPRVADRQTTVRVMTENKNAPEALERSKTFFEDTMKGRDFMTQNVMNQFSEQSAAMSAAKRAADAQRANISGASQSTQNLLGRLSDRDIEQQRQQGLTQQAQVLGQRADNAASQLANIGQFEKQMEFTEKQYDQQQSDKEYKEALVTSDPTTADGIKAITAAAAKAGYTNLKFDKLIADRWEARKDKANTEVYNWVTTNKDAYFKDGKYDTEAMKKDLAFKRSMEEAWNAEQKGASSLKWDDLSDSTQQAWIQRQIKTAMMTDRQQAANEFMAGMNDYMSSQEYLGLSKEQQQQVVEGLQKTAQLIKSGLSVEIVNGRVQVKDPATGKIISQTGVFDKNTGLEYTKVDDNTIKAGGMTFTKNETGKWETADKLIPVDDTSGNIAKAVKDGTAIEYDSRGNETGKYTYDAGTGIITRVGKGNKGTVTSYTKEINGKYYNVDKNGNIIKGDKTEATKEQLGYINEVLGTKSDSADGAADIGVGKKAGDVWTSTDGKIYIKGADGKSTETTLDKLTPSDMTKWIEQSTNLSASDAATGGFGSFLATKYPVASPTKYMTAANIRLSNFYKDNKSTLTDSALAKIAKNNMSSAATITDHDAYNLWRELPEGSVVSFTLPNSTLDNNSKKTTISGVIKSVKNGTETVGGITNDEYAEYEVVDENGKTVKFRYYHNWTSNWRMV